MQALNRIGNDRRRRSCPSKMKKKKKKKKKEEYNINNQRYNYYVNVDNSSLLPLATRTEIEEGAKRNDCSIGPLEDYTKDMVVQQDR